MESAGIFFLPPPVQSFPLAAVGAGTTVLFTGRGRLYGWSLNAANTATGDLFDGPAASGQRVGSYSIATANPPFAWFGPAGIELLSGLTLVTAVAASTGCIYYQTETRLNDWLTEVQNRSGVQYVTGSNWRGIATPAEG